ncbi:MAG: hypothetical protein PHY42_03315 [Bacilli bacterium]|nr:hypothetical protein [Bacilli bacterium]
MIVEVGVGSDDLLEIEDFERVSGAVNWDACGTYELTYIRTQDLLYVAKTIHIIGRNELDEGMAFYQEVNTEEVGTATYIIKDCVFESEDNYFLLGSVDFHEPKKHSLLLQEYAFIRYYQNHKLHFEKIFSLSYGYISWGMTSEAGLVFFLTYILMDHTNVQLGEITHNGTIIRCRDFGGQGQELGFCAQADEDSITLVLTSSSKDAPWNIPEPLLNGLVVLKVEKTNWDILHSRIIGNNRRNRWIDVVWMNGYLYGLLEVLGATGSFPCESDTQYQKFGIILDASLELVRTTPISASIGSTRLACNQEMLYLFVSYWEDNQSKMDIHCYNGAFERLSQQVYLHEDSDEKLIYRECQTSHEGTTYFFFDIVSRLTSQEKFFGVFQMDGMTMIPWTYQGKLEDAYGACYDDGWWIIGKREEELVTIELTTIRTPLYKSHAYGYEVIPQKYVLIDGVMAGYTGEPQVKKRFGCYEERTIYEGPSATIVLLNRFYVPFVSNLSMNETYDCGFAPSFNGDATLNEMPFSSNTSILKPGVYQLIIIGEGQLRKVFDFKVEDLTPTVENFEMIPIPLFYQKACPTPPFLPLEATYNGGVISEPREYTGWFLVFFFTLTGTVFALIIHPKRKNHL